MPGIEQIHVTPNGSGGPMSLPAPDEFHVVELATGVLEVHDPLFEEPYCIGDGSLVTDATADQILVASFQHFGIHGSTRQLTRTEMFEPKPGAGRWSRSQHMLSTAAMTAQFGGDPNQIVSMGLHDNGHRVRSHCAEKVLQNGRRYENLHDQDFLEFLQRSGFIARLGELGLVQLDSDGRLPQDHALPGLADLEAESFVKWPSKTGNLEVERLQYIAHEMSIWMHKPQTVRDMLAHVYRDRESEHGDHLVFDDADAALMLAAGQTRCYSEYWADPMTCAIDELFVVLQRYALTSRDPSMAAFTSRHPADVLYTTEELWQEALLVFCERDPAASGLLKIISGLCAAQRQGHNRLNEGQHYDGPAWPSWVGAFTSGRSDGSAVRSYRRHYEYLVVETAPAKTRAVNPWVQVPGQPLRRLTDPEVCPQFAAYRKAQTRWAVQGYNLVVDLSSRHLGLSTQEVKSISEAMNAAVQERWQQALQRPPMSPEEFVAYLAQGAADYRQRGTFAGASEVLPPSRQRAG